MDSKFFSFWWKSSAVVLLVLWGPGACEKFLAKKNGPAKGVFRTTQYEWMSKPDGPWPTETLKNYCNSVRLDDGGWMVPGDEQIDELIKERDSKQVREQQVYGLHHGVYFYLHRGALGQLIDLSTGETVSAFALHWPDGRPLDRTHSIRCFRKNPAY